MVLLGDSILDEKDAREKIKEYTAYQEQRKNRFIKFGKTMLNANSKKYRNVDARTFICKQCDYTTPSRSNWWRHKQTQKHKTLFTV